MTGPAGQPIEQPSYPIPRPTIDRDSRFTKGLAFDVADVLARHGYPPLRTGADLVRLQQALFTLIYQSATSHTDTEENL